MPSSTQESSPSTVRPTSVGLFDLSAHGEFEVPGPGCLSSGADERQRRGIPVDLPDPVLTMMIPMRGIDDLLVYTFPDRAYLVVNAANIEKDFTGCRPTALRVNWSIRSDETALVAIQGPRPRR